MQSELIELLDPTLREAMSNSPPLLPHREHGNARPFWMLSNVDADLSLVQVLELLSTYDTELADLSTAQGAPSPPSIMDMINIVAIAPAELLPPPPDRRDGRPPPPRTASYLLLPEKEPSW